MYMFMGIGAGVICALIILMILKLVRGKNGSCKGEPDERQERLRGNGYKFGYFTMLAGIAVVLFIAGRTNSVAVATLGVWISVLVSLLVFAGYCIWNDAYYGVKANPRKYIILMILITVVDGINTYLQSLNGWIMEDGTLNTGAVSMLAATIAFGGVLLIMLAKQLKDRREREGEDEES
ncbi:MAG: hypothetical protein IJH91_10365 [Mogibacterium sp.]|nr:hypothetical protein [Mogibacterium sp.]